MASERHSGPQDVVRPASSSPGITDRPADETLQRWFSPILANGSRWCASNLETTCAFLRVGEFELPLTVNMGQWENAWICSPYTHYVSYAAEEIRRAVSRTLSLPGATVLRALGWWFRRNDLNRVVMVNNWLMSTNPWPSWDGGGMEPALAAIIDRWPDHAVLFRSLNARSDTPLLEALARAGARVVPSRQVWLFEPDSPGVARATNWGHDLRLLRQDDLERVPHGDLRPGDFTRLADLYRQLYLVKYSRHNPAYSPAWLLHVWRTGLLRFTALREPGGEIVGVEARAVIHGTMVSPVVGYALDRPTSLGLYRRLAAIPVLAAREEGVLLNLSAGAGRFKALRGGEPVLEYIAVLDRHLPRRRRLPWTLVDAVSRHVLAPVALRRGL